jgi:Kdo2-lipid IVA lauroyltransferase/acyltransferase
MKNMGLKEKTERLAGRILTYFLMIIVKSVPEIMLYRFSQLLGNASFFLADKRRNRTFENLTIAFKNEKSSQEIKRMAKQVFCEIAEGGVDTAIRLLKDAAIQKTLIQDISVEGAEYLDEALKNKKGVICVGAHFGNFLLLALRLALKGYPCNMIIKDADNPVVAEIWHNLMRGAGVQWIPARPRIKAVSDSLKWLRNGGILFFYADQHKSDGVYVEFFGRPAGTVEGPALLHLKTGATILCAFIIRLGRKKHKIVITPPIPATKTGNRQEDVYQITKAFTKTIEDFVRQYPEQWWWPHKRWKKNIDVK